MQHEMSRSLTPNWHKTFGCIYFQCTRGDVQSFAYIPGYCITNAHTWGGHECVCVLLYCMTEGGFPNAIVWWATLMWSIRFHTVDVAFLWLITYTSHSLVVYKNSSNRAKLHVWAMSMCFCSHRSRLPILLNFPLWHFIVKAKNRVANMRQTCHSSYGSAKCSGK